MSMFRGLSIGTAASRAKSEDELLAELEASAGAAGAAAAEKAMAEETHISRARSWRDLVAVVADGVDHGPFHGWPEPSDTASRETRRWLRIIRLITEMRAATEGDEVLRWLDTPLADLGGLTPFNATNGLYDEVQALVRLTGGRPLEPGSIEGALFADFQQVRPKIGAALEGDSSLLSNIVRLLLANGRSLHEASLELTCMTVGGRDRTLYRMASAPTPDIQAIVLALADACGIDTPNLPALS